MVFHLPELPYDKGALAPHISAETLEYHHGKHHAAYVDKLNELVAGSPWAEKTLETIVREVGPTTSITGTPGRATSRRSGTW